MRTKLIESDHFVIMSFGSWWTMNKIDISEESVRKHENEGEIKIIIKYLKKSCIF